MSYIIPILLFIIGLQFLIITALYADRMIFMYERGEIDMNMLKMDDKVYDVLKWICMLFLPALAVLVKTICTIWNLPLGEEISTTIMAIDAFLGAILGISHIQFKKGEENANN